MTKISERVVVTRSFLGICHMQVCATADATDEEILYTANAKNPSGTSLGWGKVYRRGKNKPVTCNDDANRKHFILSC